MRDEVNHEQSEAVAGGHMDRHNPLCVVVLDNGVDRDKCAVRGLSRYPAGSQR